MRRIDKWKLLSEWRQDLQIEKDFENALAVNARKDGMQLERVFRDNSWGMVFVSSTLIVLPKTNPQTHMSRNYKLDCKRHSSVIRTVALLPSH
jgi:hypothetical protein